MAMMKEQLTALVDLWMAINDMPCDTPEEISAYIKAADTFWTTLITVSKVLGCGPFELLAIIEDAIEALYY